VSKYLSIPKIYGYVASYMGYMATYNPACKLTTLKLKTLLSELSTPLILLPDSVEPTNSLSTIISRTLRSQLTGYEPN